LVEPLKRTPSTTGLLVGISAFPVLEVEGRLGEVVKRVFDLRLLRHERLLFLIISFLGLGLLLGFRSSGSGSRLGRLLFHGGHELNGLFGVDDRAVYLLNLGLVGDGLKMPDEIGEFGTQGRINGDIHGFLDEGSDVEIGECNAFAYEEGARGYVCLKGVECAVLAFNKEGMGLQRILEFALY